MATPPTPPTEADDPRILKVHWAVFGLLQTICLILITSAIFIIALSSTDPVVRSALTQIAGANLGVLLVAIWYRIRILPRIMGWKWAP